MANNGYHVKLTEPAKTDLEEIDDYISNELSAPLTAEKMIDTIEEALAKLSFSPQSYSKVRDDRLSAKGYRWIGMKHYLAFYTIDEPQKTVYVERILYGRRDWKRIL
jgi:addiction module RelE/StbE family toxin